MVEDCNEMNCNNNLKFGVNCIYVLVGLIDL